MVTSTSSPRVELTQPLWGSCIEFARPRSLGRVGGLADGFQSTASSGLSATGAKQEHAHLSAPRPPVRAGQSWAGAGPGHSQNREERGGEARASTTSYPQTRPRRPQPRPRRRRRRCRRPRGMACLMAAFSVGTAMVSRASFAVGAGLYLLGKQETQSRAR